MSTKPHRVRLSITMPKWLHNEVVLRGEKRGYGPTELITNLVVNWVAEEKTIESEKSHRVPSSLLHTRATIPEIRKDATLEDECMRELRAMGL